MQHIKTIRTIIFVLIFLVATAIIFCSFYTFPQKINVTYPAIQFIQGDPSSAISTKITINGTITTPLFRSQKFIGSIMIDNLDFTKNYDLTDVDFSQKTRDKFTPIGYVNLKLEDASDVELLMIFQTNNFEQLEIGFYHPSNQKIVAPADNYESAVAIDKKLNHL